MIATPKTAGEKTLALDIAAGAADLSGKEILTLDFPMTRDHEALRKSHLAAAEAMEAHLRQGRDVAMLNLGDVSIYSTFAYVMTLVTSHGFPAVMIPASPASAPWPQPWGKASPPCTSPSTSFRRPAAPTEKALQLPRHQDPS